MSSCYSQVLLALCAWREARGEGDVGIAAVCWTVKNRAARPGWWGDSIVNCVRQPWQFTSISGTGDPQLRLWPAENDPVWLRCLAIAEQVMAGTFPDPTQGSTFYFDARMDNAMPHWAKPPLEHKCNVGRLRFWG